MLKFTIRELLLLTAFVCVAVAWYIDHGRQVEQTRVWQSRARWAGHVLYRNADIEWPIAGSENFYPPR